MRWLLYLFLFMLCACRQVVPVETGEITAFFSQFQEFQKRDSSDISYTKELCVIDSAEVSEEGFIDLIEKEKLFTAQDIDYLKSQLFTQSPIVWDYSFFDTTKIIKIHIVPRLFIDSSIKPGPPFSRLPTHISMSKPLFSKGKKYCLFFYDYYCGSLCAETAAKLYEKINGKWVVVKTYFSSVS